MGEGGIRIGVRRAQDLAGRRVRVAAIGSANPICGELVAVGDDVVFLRPESPPGGAPGGMLYVPLASVAEVSLPTSG